MMLSQTLTTRVINVKKVAFGNKEHTTSHIATLVNMRFSNEDTFSVDKVHFYEVLLLQYFVTLP